MALERRTNDIRPRAASDALASIQAKFFRGLGDPTRLAIVRILLREPQPVNGLAGLLGMSQSRVSNHLACLRWCGYVTARRIGRSIEYSVSDRRVRALLDAADAMVSENAQRVVACTRIDGRAAGKRHER